MTRTAAKRAQIRMEKRLQEEKQASGLTAVEESEADSALNGVSSTPDPTESSRASTEPSTTPEGEDLPARVRAFPAFLRNATSKASAEVDVARKDTSPPVYLKSAQVVLERKESRPLDRFAPIYIQQWLLQVNLQSPLQIIPRSDAESGVFNPDPIIHSLYPGGFIVPTQHQYQNKRNELYRDVTKVDCHPPVPQPSLLLQQPARVAALPIRKPDGSSKVVSPPSSSLPPPNLPTVPWASAEYEKSIADQLPALTPEKYAHFWIPLERLEFRTRSLQLEKANLYAVPIIPHRDRNVLLYRLEARSIREGWPPVNLSDVVHLRQVWPETKTWQELEFHATVFSINRAAGEVMLRCDRLIQHYAGLVFNVKFTTPDRILHCWMRATEEMALALRWQNGVKGERVRSVAETWLFPEIEDAVQNSYPNVSHLEGRGGTWVNDHLNTEQKHAVEAILWGKHKTPYIIHGPPGTGKTSTLVEAIPQLLRHENFSILVCGASDPSADTLAKRLAVHLTPMELFRLNSSSRPFAEIPSNLLPFCHISNEAFDIPPLPILLSKRVIVTSCVDASLLTSVKCTNHDLGSLEIFTHASIHPREPLNRPTPHFGALLIDEAGQATEPDVLCAMAAVIVSDERSAFRPSLILCGDANQLGPQIISTECRNKNLDISLMERLSERPAYSQHLYARRNRKLLPPNAGLCLDTSFCNLVKNYRSATPILMLPSTMFYQETLEPFAPESTQKSKLQKWSGLARQGFPISFHGVEGLDEPVDEGASFWNKTEVEQVVAACINLIDHCSGSGAGGLKPSEISVISPFREQVWQIRMALRKVSLYDVDVGNTEALQGAENRVVIISTVRSTPRWLALDRDKGLGLVYEPKRWNVAMTRAKELLIVFGNTPLLTRDMYWKAFYRFCCRNKCYEGPAIEDDSLTANAYLISRLEETYWKERNGKKGGESSLENDFDLLVGSLARDTLADEDED